MRGQARIHVRDNRVGLCQIPSLVCLDSRQIPLLREQGIVRHVARREHRTNQRKGKDREHNIVGPPEGDGPGGCGQVKKFAAIRQVS